MGIGSPKSVFQRLVVGQIATNGVHAVQLVELGKCSGPEVAPILLLPKVEKPVRVTVKKPKPVIPTSPAQCMVVGQIGQYMVHAVRLVELGKCSAPELAPILLLPKMGTTVRVAVRKPSPVIPTSHALSGTTL